MNGRARLPEVPSSALRDVAAPERVERVWKRLEHDLAGTAPRSRGSFEWAWALAGVCIIFLSGFFVGLGWHRGDPGPRQPSAEYEPIEPRDNSPATETQRRGPSDEQPRPDEPRKKQPRLRAAPTPPEIDLGPPVPLSLPPQGVDPGPPDWQRAWLEDGDTERAARAIVRQGGFDKVIAQASPEQLMILVNIAQAAGEPSRALAALRRVVDSFPKDPAAPQAAFMLGTALDKAGDRVGAARAFATCRDLSPRSDIAEDALARQIDSALEQGDLAEAHRLFDQYERDFPQGNRLGEFRTALSSAAGVATSSAAAEADPQKSDAGATPAGRSP